MPRPTSKAQLIEQTVTNYDKLQVELEKMTSADMIKVQIVEAWTAKDILAHLFAWQQMVLNWYAIGKNGGEPITPSEKYTWREIPALNQEIYETYRDCPLEDITEKFEASHQQVLATIETIDNDELFTPKIYKWTKSTTLGSYFVSATSSHYDWARKEIRHGLKKIRS